MNYFFLLFFSFIFSTETDVSVDDIMSKSDDDSDDDEEEIDF